jgi:protein-S-isoprenylcysteine O-methyltransferase Ste14
MVSARKRVRGTAQQPAVREPLLGRVLYLGLMSVGFILLFRHLFWPVAEIQMWPSSGVSLAVGLAVQVAGLAFAIWARHTLGTNWAARVTTGSSQELIAHGPYGKVRHPIYSGLLLAVLGTAILVGQVRAFAGLLLVIIGVAMKIRREEAALRRHFGEAYDLYAARVPALLPGLGRR